MVHILSRSSNTIQTHDEQANDCFHRACSDFIVVDIDVFVRHLGCHALTNSKVFGFHRSIIVKDDAFFISVCLHIAVIARVDKFESVWVVPTLDHLGVSKMILSFF